MYMATTQSEPTQLLSVKDILQRAFILFKENIKLILTVVLVVYIPLNLILEALPLSRLFVEDPVRALKIYVRFAQLLEFLIGVIAAMAIVYALKNKLQGITITAKEALKKSLSKWPKAIVTGLLAAVCLLGLFLLLIVPGIIFLLYWAFITYIVILNDKWGWSALAYSKSIVSGRWWKLFGRGLALTAIGILITLILGGLGFFLPDYYAINVAFDIVIDFVMSFFTVAWLIVFLNLEETSQT